MKVVQAALLSELPWWPSPPLLAVAVHFHLFAVWYASAIAVLLQSLTVELKAAIAFVQPLRAVVVFPTQAVHHGCGLFALVGLWLEAFAGYVLHTGPLPTTTLSAARLRLSPPDPNFWLRSMRTCTACNIDIARNACSTETEVGDEVACEVRAHVACWLDASDFNRRSTAFSALPASNN